MHSAPSNYPKSIIYMTKSILQSRGAPSQKSVSQKGNCEPLLFFFCSRDEFGTFKLPIISGIFDKKIIPHQQPGDDVIHRIIFFSKFELA
jgi:hypothetical protein